MTIRAVVSQLHCKLLGAARPSAGPDDYVVAVRKSCLAAVRVGNSGCHYLVLGQTSSGQKVVALSDTLQSTICVVSSSTVMVGVPNADEGSLLYGMAEEVIAETLLRETTGTVFVHEPSPTLAHRFATLAAC